VETMSFFVLQLLFTFFCVLIVYFMCIDRSISLGDFITLCMFLMFSIIGIRIVALLEKLILQ